MVVDVADPAGQKAAAQHFLFSCGLGRIDPVKFGTQKVEEPGVDEQLADLPGLRQVLNQLSEVGGSEAGLVRDLALQ